MAKKRPDGDGTVRKRKDGRWEGRIVIRHKEDGTPLFKSVFAKTQKELMPKLHAAIDEYRGVDLSENGSMTLEEWIDRWLEEYAIPTLRPGTIAGYTNDIRNHIRPALGDKQIRFITRADVQKFYNALKRKKCQYRIHGVGKTLADSTVRGIHMLLHEIMDAAVRVRLISKNPTNGTTIPKCNYPPKRILNEEQLDTFMEAIRNESLWGETKTEKGMRSILLPPSTLHLLKERRKIALTEWIFPSLLAPENPTSPSTAYQRLKVILKGAGLPDIRFHDLRHTFATHALTSGVDAKTLSGILGHTNASFTVNIKNSHTQKNLIVQVA